MRWCLSHRAERRTRIIADRHYNRQKPGTRQFVPPGRCLVLISDDGRGAWITSWPFAEYVRHAWPGAWVNSLFRNEGAGLSSELIREAVAATRAYFGEPPALGMVSFIDPDKTKHKRDPGRCYKRAGFVCAECLRPKCNGYRRPTRGAEGPTYRCGWTKGGLRALRLLPEAMPLAESAHGTQGRLVA